MTWQGRVAAVALIAAIALAVGDVVGPPWNLGLIGVAVLAAWRYTDGFWKRVGLGLAGGALAGLLILGPGLRVAMRVVAVMDPFKTPEFSVEGTMFIVVGIGAIFGAVFGLQGNLMRVVLGIRSAIGGGLILGGWFMLELLRSEELRSEFFEFGAGAWINIPLFGVFAIGYGIAAMAISDLLDRRWSRTPVTEEEKVPALTSGERG